MRFCTITLGCKANQYDTGTIAGTLIDRGYKQVRPGDGCDVCIINTCAVTAESVRKSRQAVRRAKRSEPDALIAVCGCFSQIEGDKAALLGADLMGGTGDRETFTDELERLWKNSRNLHSDEIQDKKSDTCYSKNVRTRALLKIQDGCDNHCAYCIIPKARGRSRSMPLSDIADKAKEYEENGYKEIVLTGIEISSYSPGVIQAVKTVSEYAPNARIRLGSLDPGILTSDFIKQMKSTKNLCEHFHISLQSGCDATLTRMKRRYTTGQVSDAINEIRKNFENCGITADLITGFPGESDEEFAQTLAFIEKAAFSGMHIFPYSKRPGTAAEIMPGQISDGIKRKRAKIASQTASKLNEDFKTAQIGKTLEVLFETVKNKKSFGHARNYLAVAAENSIDKNTLANVRITSIKNGVLFGEII